MKLSFGQSRAALGRSSGWPRFGSGGPGARPLWTQMLLNPGLLALELLVVLLDQLERRIRHLRVVVPPLPHEAVRVVVHLGGVRDVVALPRVRLVLVDLLLDERQVALADVEQAVAEHARGAGDLVDEVPRGGGLGGGEDLAALGLLGVPRRPGRLALDLDHRGGHVAQQADRDLAVQIHVLDELRDVGVAGIDRQADERRVPDAPGVAPLVLLPARIEGIRLDAGGRRRPLGDGPQVGRRRPAAADEVQLIVEDEQVLRRGRLRRSAAGSNSSAGLTLKNRP